MIKNGHSLSFSSDVQKEMRDNGLDPEPKKDICQVLSHDFKMIYRKVHKIQVHTNSDRSLVLR
jgi:hypothetical protein